MAVDTHEGVIVEWRPHSPFGYAQCGTERVFLHIRNFAGRTKWPEEHDQVSFVLGTDPTGRPCAQQIILLSRGSVLGWRHFVVVALLLVLPALALPELREWLRPWWVVLCTLTTSALAGLNLWFDKRFAIAARSRIPEATLHLFELTGGWPGSFLAQRFFRHKISKRSYQALFWLIVLIHQLFALDLILGGLLSQGLQHLDRPA
jgi:uncharacterized membrane protein YsdA (DUF1294 family)